MNAVGFYSKITFANESKEDSASKLNEKIKRLSIAFIAYLKISFLTISKKLWHLIYYYGHIAITRLITFIFFRQYLLFPTFNLPKHRSCTTFENFKNSFATITLTKEVKFAKENDPDFWIHGLCFGQTLCFANFYLKNKCILPTLTQKFKNGVEPKACKAQFIYRSIVIKKRAVLSSIEFETYIVDLISKNLFKNINIEFSSEIYNNFAIHKEAYFNTLPNGCYILSFDAVYRLTNTETGHLLFFDKRDKDFYLFDSNFGFFFANSLFVMKFYSAVIKFTQINLIKIKN
ncbi:MAG: hypothetical protein BGO10_09405 [Chlamydia sp. 32-24]|nr:MAG: hypothetical protein BGO10_09405 [Chlamydia sp. 32-24]